MVSTSAAIRAHEGKLRGDGEGAAAAQPDACVAAAALDYSIITSRAGFDALAGEWNALFARAGNGIQAFQTFDWLWHWCNHYLDATSGRHSLAIVTGRLHGKLVLIWPLVTERSAAGVRLTSMGAPVGQYSDALVEPSPHAAEQLRGAWGKVVAAVKPDLAWLPRVREDATIAPVVRELGALAVQRMEAPYIDLSDTPDFDAYMRRRSAPARKRLRAAERRVAKLNSQIVTYAQGNESGEVASQIIEMKRHQLAARGLMSPAFADMRLRSFFADAARGGRHPGGAQAITLRCDGDLAAANIVIGCRDRVLGHIFTYDSRYAKDSVGAYLINKTIGHAIAAGYKTFDLLSPADPYKLRSADGTVEVINWAIPLTAKGTAFTRIHLMLVRPLLKAAFERMPAKLRSYVTRRYYG